MKIDVGGCWRGGSAEKHIGKGEIFYGQRRHLTHYATTACYHWKLKNTSRLEGRPHDQVQ